MYKLQWFYAYEWHDKYWKWITTNLYKPPPQTVMVYTTHIPTTLARLD